MREKKDSIFNSEILNQTAHLTNEQFGLLIRIAMIEDDDANEKRYENLRNIFFNAYLKQEEEWKKQFEEIIENPSIMNAYNLIFGSAAKSRKGYNNLKQKLENKDNAEENNNNLKTEEKPKPNPDFISAPDGTQANYVRNENFKLISFELENITLNFYGLEKNIPTEKDVDKVFKIQMLDIDDITTAWYYGHNEQWKNGWKTYFNIN